MRAFSHLPAKRVAAGPISQRGAQAFGSQFQRTEPSAPGTRAEDGISAAKASGVFDVVRQQYNRDDSPHFMDEDGNLRPRDEAHQQDSPAPRDPRSPLGVAGAPARPAWGTGNAANGDSSRSPLTQPPASDDTRPWYMPAITPEDLDPQHFDDDDAASSHSGPKVRPEVQDLVYRTHGESPPKPVPQDLVYRFKGSAEEAKENNMGYYQNTAAPADGRGHLAQQTNTYGAAPDNQPKATAPSTYKPYKSIFQDANDGRKKHEAKAEPTVEMLEQEEKHLQLQVAGAELALHKHHAGSTRLIEIRAVVEAADFSQDRAREMAPELLDLAVELGNKIFDLDPEDIIEKINAAIAKRKEQVIQYQNDIAKAKGKLKEAIAKTEVAKGEEKKRELEEKRRQQLEEKKRQQDKDKKMWESQEREKELQELKEKYEQGRQRQKQQR